jgi:putative ABC transport system permease protein
MLRSFLTITFRILWRDWTVSSINVIGLSTGMTAFVFIMLYVHHEFSYDKFNENYKRIVRLEGDEYARLPMMVAEHLRGSLPEIENVSQFANIGISRVIFSPAENPDDAKTIELKGVFADTSAVRIFTFSFIQGNPKTALVNPMTVVLTETSALKLFGRTDIVDQTVQLGADTYTITGVIKDVEDAHVEIDALFSFESMHHILKVKKENDDEFDYGQVHTSLDLYSATYLLLSPGANHNNLEVKINEVLKEINNGKVFNLEFQRFHMRSLSDLYLDGETKLGSYGIHGNQKLVYTLIAIGILLLVLACINYINLTTARGSTRTKEIAIKQMSGASSAQLRLQVILESILVSMISLLVAITMIQLSLDKFNQFTSVNISFAGLNQVFIWSIIIGGGILLGALAGIYPAIYLTSTRPLALMKTSKIKLSGKGNFRSGLMTLQFALSMVMIVAIITNLRQMNYIQTADLGFEKEYVVSVTASFSGLRNTNPSSARSVFRENLLQHTEIQKVSYSWGNPGVGTFAGPTFEINGLKKDFPMLGVDADYVACMGLKIIDGRDFDGSNLADRSEFFRESAVLVNEELVKTFGLQNPVGTTFKSNDGSLQFRIIGVVKNFHFKSLHENIAPLLLAWTDVPGRLANIKIQTFNVSRSMEIIEKEFKKVFGNAPFEYSFMDDILDRQYKSDKQLVTMITLFTVLAVIIACLGLFALSSFMVAGRTKEIGVRKVLGASVVIIYSMLSWEFLKWILVAIVIAAPFAWYLMKMWLNTFAYHIELGFDVFVIAALIAIGIALLTVTGQTLKVARANPVDSLKYE